jgi:hypothetical protein
VTWVVMALGAEGCRIMLLLVGVQGSSMTLQATFGWHVPISVGRASEARLEVSGSGRFLDRYG